MTGFPKGLYTPHAPEETRDIYAGWADDYDAAVEGAGYATPARVAAALAAHLPERDAPVMDFGCGTGLSGAALAQEGFTTIDGTDITPEMLEKARAKGVYRALRAGTPGEAGDLSGHAAVVATGVISLGAAPPETLPMLLAAMAPGALLAFSYNQGTLAEAPYQHALADAQTSGHDLLWAQRGPHLPHHEGAEHSVVYVLRRAG